MNQSLVKEFASPGKAYRSKPFWAWNGKLEPDELRRQLRLFKQMGMGGAFMHSRVGLETGYLSDEWFDCIRACIDESEKLGMEAWLYDEDRWPSGPAGGLVTKNPRYRMRYLSMEQLNAAKGFKPGSDVLGLFSARISGDSAADVKRLAKGRKPVLSTGESLLVFRMKTAPLTDYYNGYTYLDTLSHEAVAEFIRVTHDAYREKIGEHFGKTVPGIFTDEPQYGGKFYGLQYCNDGKSLPWTPGLPKAFRERCGYDILDHLPELFVDVEGEPVSRARYHYHECATFLFVDAFSRQIGEWCEQNHMQHTGHVLLEETPTLQTRFVGSAMRFYEYMQLPGMDNLGQYQREYITAKQVGSVARQFDRKWRLSELCGCTGWDFSFAGHKAIGDWHAALGINLRCPHLSLYTMEGEAKRDYPASISYQSPWWDSYTKVEDYFARIHTVMTRGREVRDLLVIHPVESSWLQCNRSWAGKRTGDMELLDRDFIALSDELLARNIDFDYGEEDILARHAQVVRRKDGPRLVVGKAAYKAVAVPPLATMRRSTLELLKQFQKAGGTVAFTGGVAGYVDADPSDDVVAFASECNTGDGWLDRIEPLCRCVSIVDGKGNEIVPALHLLREDREAFYLFVCNTGHDFRRTEGVEDIPVRKRTACFDEVWISGFEPCAGKPAELDPDSGRMFSADVRKSSKGWKIRTSLPVLGSRLFMIPKKKPTHPQRLPKKRTLSVARTRTLNPKVWDIALSESNNLVLDRPRFRIGSRRWQKEDEILRIDRAVRDHLGLKYRGGEMLQPWIRKKEKNPPSVPVALTFNWDVKAIPSGELFLGIERPELYEIRLNGTRIDCDMDAGWWVDQSLRKIPFSPAQLTAGSNELTLRCDYDENHPGLEMVYLLGNFGVSIKNGMPVLDRPVEHLRLGDWTKQGLPFYSGNVVYRTTVALHLAGKEKGFIQIGNIEGTAVRLHVNGQCVGVLAWAPWELEMTAYLREGRNELAVEVVGHRRNSHGPLHLNRPDAPVIGPFSFMTSGETWNDAYGLVPLGLVKPPKLIIKA